MAVVAVLALRQPGTPSASGSAAPATGGTTSSRTTATSSRTTAAPSTAASTTAASSSPTTAPRTSPTSSPSIAVKSIPLVVLNNTTTTGLAASAAQRFESGGWTVTSSGNLDNTIVSTCAYYDPSVAGAKAAALALQQQYPTIKRVEKKFPELPSGPVVVVLTPDYSSD